MIAKISPSILSPSINLDLNHNSSAVSCNTAQAAAPHVTSHHVHPQSQAVLSVSQPHPGVRVVVSSSPQLVRPGVMRMALVVCGGAELGEACCQVLCGSLLLH